MKNTKKIYDSVHGFIEVDEFEAELIYSPVFQRLYYIHQLGITYLVYPGATHKRFEHSLGVMELSSRIYKQLTAQAQGSKFEGIVPVYGSNEHKYWKSVVRLAALCHDIGHLPFSHVAEKQLLGAKGHELMTQKIINGQHFKNIVSKLKTYWSQFNINRDVAKDIIKVSIGQKEFLETFSEWEKVLTEIITGDFFGADRIDYLLRDAKCTGLAYGLFDYNQLITSLRIIEDNKTLKVGISENGIESCEALLLARHFMHKRLYQYPNVKAYSFHLSRFMAEKYKDINLNIEKYISFTDNEVLADINNASKDPSNPGHIDAKALFSRENRFFAIPLDSNITNNDLDVIQKLINIPDKDFYFDLSKKSTDTPYMDFPVFREAGQIVKGNDLNMIKVPSKNRSWLYLSSQWLERVHEEIKKISLYKK